MRSKVQANLQKSQPRSQTQFNPKKSDTNPVVSKRNLEKLDSASVDRGVNYARSNMLLSSPQSQSEHFKFAGSPENMNIFGQPNYDSRITFSAEKVHEDESSNFDGKHISK